MQLKNTKTTKTDTEEHQKYRKKLNSERFHVVRVMLHSIHTIIHLNGISNELFRSSKRTGYIIRGL